MHEQERSPHKRRRILVATSRVHALRHILTALKPFCDVVVGGDLEHCMVVLENDARYDAILVDGDSIRAGSLLAYESLRTWFPAYAARAAFICSAAEAASLRARGIKVIAKPATLSDLLDTLGA